jgi:hypothetical protein
MSIGIVRGARGNVKANREISATIPDNCWGLNALRLANALKIAGSTLAGRQQPTGDIGRWLVGGLVGGHGDRALAARQMKSSARSLLAELTPAAPDAG